MPRFGILAALTLKKPLGWHQLSPFPEYCTDANALNHICAAFDAA
jgi:hypothetical protein